MPMLTVNGANLYYLEAGAGAPVLFIHGMCGHANVWDDQVRRLSPDFRCISYDRRGHSRSSLGQVQQRTVQLHADDAAGLIGGLDIAPCLVVSSSGGARIAVDLVRRYPGLVRAAALSEPPLFALDPSGAAAFVAELKPSLDSAFQQGGARAAVDAFFGYVCPGLWTAIDEERRDTYRANAEELFGDLQMPPYEIDVAALESIQVPCLVIRGTHSHPLLINLANLLAKHLPAARSLVLTGSGHVTYAEKPEDFSEAVRSFFQQRFVPDEARL